MIHNAFRMTDLFGFVFGNQIEMYFSERVFRFKVNRCNILTEQNGTKLFGLMKQFQTLFFFSINDIGEKILSSIK